MNQRNRNRRQLGGEYESQAAAFLNRKGYRILETNFYSRFGEIDLIAQDGPVIVFVEVKYRENLAAGAPEEAVTWQKQKKICRTADYYRVLRRISMDLPCRFDVISICGSRIHHIWNAFPYRGSGW